MDAAQIEKYMMGFYGYGNWQNPTWFIGMEEGGCSTLDEFSRRVGVWVQRGCTELEEARSYHKTIEVDQWFEKGARLQKTWEQLIRIYCSLHGRRTDKDSIRHYQINEFGNQRNGFAVVELLPLPSKKATDWIYSEIKELPYLASREKYKRNVCPKRVDELGWRIQTHRPKYVVCYGATHRDWLRDLMGYDMRETSLDKVFEGKLGDTLVLLIPHPVSHGRMHNDWAGIGEYLRDASTSSA